MDSKIGDHSVIVPVDLSVCDERSVKMACYRMAGMASTVLERAGEALLNVVLTPIEGSDASASDLRERFTRELVDQDLRLEIARETESIRNLIIAHALSKVPLVNAQLDEEEYRGGLK